MESVIYNDDCLNKFKDVSNNSVQLVVVDLPYSQTACKWDKCIDLEKMWENLKRILKPNGQIIFFCTTKFGIDLILSNRKWFRYDIVWEKTTNAGFLCANKMPMRKHEMIYLFHNDKKPKDLKWIYNPQKTEGTPFKGSKKAPTTGYAKIYNALIKPIDNNGDRHPVSIIKVSNPSQKSLHPTQKPVALCEWLIKTYSNEGDMIMDFTMGSGSTIIACINTNRKYIGIEKDEAIFLTAEKRINERLSELIAEK